MSRRGRIFPEQNKLKFDFGEFHPKNFRLKPSNPTPKKGLVPYFDFVKFYCLFFTLFDAMSNETKLSNINGITPPFCRPTERRGFGDKRP